MTISRRRQNRKFVSKNTFFVIVAIVFVVGLLSGVVVYSIITAKTSTVAPPLPMPEVGNVTQTTKIVSVSSDGTGLVTGLSVELKKGTGRILDDTQPMMGIDFQYAERTAVKVASEITGVALDDDGIGLKGVDLLFTVTIAKGQQTEIQAIDGPSAGAATTVLTIAAIQNKKIKSDVVITGTIQDDHRIGLIGGVLAKTAAAKDNGATLFLVPKGQVVEVYRQVGPFYFTRYEPISYLKDIVRQQGWQLTIQEVSTIEEALKLMLQ